MTMKYDDYFLIEEDKCWFKKKILYVETASGDFEGILSVSLQSLI